MCIWYDCYYIYNFLGVFRVEYYILFHRLDIAWNGEFWGKRSEKKWAGVRVLILLYVLSRPRSPCFYTVLFTRMTSLLIPLSLAIPSFKMHLIFPSLLLSSAYLPGSLLLYLTNILEAILIKIIQSFSPNLYNPLIINTKTRFHINIVSITFNSHLLYIIQILLFAWIRRWR